MDCFDGFHFDDDSVFYHQVDSVSDFKLLALIDDREWNFGRYRETSTAQFVCEAGLIGALEKAGTKQRVNLHRRVNDGAGDVVDAVGV